MFRFTPYNLSIYTYNFDEVAVSWLQENGTFEGAIDKAESTVS